MKREDLIKTIIDCLRELIIENPDQDLDSKSNPINGLGFTSIDGADFACSLSEKLSFTIPLEVNPFVNDKENQARNVGEMADYLLELMTPRKEL